MLPVIIWHQTTFERLTPGAREASPCYMYSICIEIFGRTLSHFVDHRSLSGLVAGRYVTDYEPCTVSNHIASEFSDNE